MGDINGQLCEWCQAPATKSFELQRRIKGARAGATTGTGQFLFSCDDDAEKAERIANEARSPHRGM